MKILVNTSSLLNQLTGIGNYTYQGTKHLVEIAPEHDYLFYYQGRFSGALLNPAAGDRESFFSTTRQIIKKVPFVSELGLKRAENFSWEKSAREHLKIIEKVGRL